MIELTDAQRTVIEEGAKTKYEDIRELESIKRYAPAIQTKVIQGMVKRELLTVKKQKGGDIYFLSEKAYAAIGKPYAEDNHGAKKTSKKQLMIELLSSKKGATLKQLMDATSWQKHSVHGAMANLRKELKEQKLDIGSSKEEKGERIYKIAPESEAQAA